MKLAQVAKLFDARVVWTNTYTLPLFGPWGPM